MENNNDKEKQHKVSENTLDLPDWINQNKYTNDDDNDADDEPKSTTVHLNYKNAEAHKENLSANNPHKVYRKKRSYKRLIAFIIILLAIIGAAIYYFWNSNNAPTMTDTAKNSSAINIMIMGVDRRADDVGRSDTLMVLTYKEGDKQASLLSLPRDTRVFIENNKYDKINHAYAYGGHELTKKTVENFLNVPIDYYVLIDIQAFEKIIDAVGGVDIDVEKRMYYEDPWDDNGGLVIDLQPGEQHMDGKTAIQYVRYRDGEGDIGRINRQQKFMKALLAQVISPAILPKLPEILKNLSSAIQTDMPLDKMISLISDLPTIQQNGLASAMVPGTPAYIEDISYWLPDIAKTRQMIADNMGITLDDAAKKNTEETIAAYQKALPKGLKMGDATDENVASKDIKNEDITVLVINSSGINGAGAEVADTLKKKGFKISSVETGNTSSREHTTITANENELNCFYGMPFECTIMPGGSSGQATVNIGLDYQN